MNYYLGLGGNLGEVEINFSKALAMLSDQLGKVISVSSIYQSESLLAGQNDYLNCVAQIQSQFSEQETLETILKIERNLGRIRDQRWGPRIIDIDIIAKAEEVYNSELCSVPHQNMQDRTFVLMPLAELAPDWRHPILKKTVNELILEIKNPTRCKILKPFSDYAF